MATPSGLYQQYIGQCLIRSDPAQLEALQHLDALHRDILDLRSVPWYRRWQRRERLRGLYLWGGVGTGKTLVMNFFYRALPDGMAWRIHFHRFMQWVHQRRQSLGERQDPLHQVATELAARYPVLCLDEFVVTDITDAMILYGLLQTLFAEGVVLVTTSNTPVSELYRSGLQRDRFLPAIQLLERHTLLLPVDRGHDYRMAFLQESSVYHSRLGPETDTAIRNTFRNLAGIHESGQDHIQIASRNIPVVATGAGVVWFDFPVLCEGNRSRSDYVEIGRQFHTLLLTNIPVLDNSQNDPARRLIELVDVLYDQAVNLILSAAAPPDALYTGKRLADPFRRTVSRLHEMSSAEYLAKPHLC